MAKRPRLPSPSSGPSTGQMRDIVQNLESKKGRQQREDDEDRAREAEIERLFKPLRERGLASSSAPGMPAPGPLKRGPRPADRKKEPAARDGRKAMTLHFPPDLPKLLKMMAASEGTTMQALVGEGIDLLLVKRGHKPFGAR